MQNNAWITAQKWSFPLRISSVSVTKSAGNCGFGHIYWRNVQWKTLFCVHWISLTFIRNFSFSLILTEIFNSEDVLVIIQSELNIFKKQQDSDNHKLLKEWLHILSDYRNYLNESLFQMHEQNDSVLDEICRNDSSISWIQ